MPSAAAFCRAIANASPSLRSAATAVAIPATSMKMINIAFLISSLYKFEEFEEFEGFEGFEGVEGFASSWGVA